ncbi:DUF1552 domain-containing protein [Stratiformator vulcanicus]|uniref:DUF1552 domain-containing protein n=1 Tax=Stratiformator vulcanicus TaxID=2527980 RepID=A0A517R1C2_9PLAN|nr:DUF1552 domain-containing protein [Stratiformator vulcanicus]QDT37705.1 hypothetical protein Pan189_20870 [Stratiformator vulcanicus]
MIKTNPVSRRKILKAGGITFALPLLESLVPQVARASEQAVEQSLPVRTAFFYIPNGVNLETWIPKQEGSDYEIPAALKPIEKVRDDITILTGLNRTYAAGTTLHSQAGSCWLTSSPPSETKDGAYPTNLTLDQMIARNVGTSSPFPSLELSCNDHTNNKETKYFESVSWYGPGYAAATEKNPREVFRRLFGVSGKGKRYRSVLDAIMEDAAGLRTDLGAGDREKLDEYFESVRSIERRINRAEKFQIDRSELPISEPAGIPEDRRDYIRLMGSLMALAFRLDLTRVATLLVDPERWDTPREYPGYFDKPQNHHVLTHTKGDEPKEALTKIDAFHVEQFAAIVEAMRETPEGDGSLLDNCQLVLGSGMGRGDWHSYRNLPVVIAGRAGGRIDPGRHVVYPKGTPLANLWLSVLDHHDIERPRYADSTAQLAGLMT